MCAAPLQRFLGGNDALTRLRDHAARLVRMQATLEKQLPAGMLGAVSVANFEDGILVLHVQTAALASRLKMSSESLRTALMAANEPVMGIRIKVRPVHSSDRHAMQTR